MERTLHTDNWPSLIPDALMQLNSRPLKRLNGLAPKEFNSQWDDYKVQQAAAASNPQPSTSQSSNSQTNQANASQAKPTVSQQLANQKAYESNPKLLQVSDFVFVDYKAKSFAKSYEIKVCFLWCTLSSDQIFPMLYKR